MQYHFEDFSYNSYEKSVNTDEMYYWAYECDWSEYPDFIATMESGKKVFIGIGLVVLFVVMMTVFNIINTTASNLHLQKKELAQLRVIGVSKKRLMKIVMLEGVISSITANIIGIIIGVMLSSMTYNMLLGLLFGMKYSFSIPAAVLGVIGSTLILCGSVYMPLRELKQDIASDLAIGGE